MLWVTTTTGDQISEQHIYRSCMLVTNTTHKCVVLAAPEFQNLNFTVFYLSTLLRSITEMFVTNTTHKCVVLPAPEFQNLNFTVFYLSTLLCSITENTPCPYFTDVELSFFFVNAILGKKVVWNDGVTKCVMNFIWTSWKSVRWLMRY
jgi:hypothetical protein